MLLAASDRTVMLASTDEKKQDPQMDLDLDLAAY